MLHHEEVLRLPSGREGVSKGAGAGAVLHHNDGTLPASSLERHLSTSYARQKKRYEKPTKIVSKRFGDDFASFRKFNVEFYREFFFPPCKPLPLEVLPAAISCGLDCNHSSWIARWN